MWRLLKHLSRTWSCAEDRRGRKNQPTRKTEKQEKKPWMLPRFQSFNSGSSDGWIMDYLNDGWLVRDRRRGRKTARHPVRRRLPLETDRLLHGRTRVRFLEDGGREVHVMIGGPHHDLKAKPGEDTPSSVYPNRILGHDNRDRWR